MKFTKLLIISIFGAVAVLIAVSTHLRAQPPAPARFIYYISTNPTALNSGQTTSVTVAAQVSADSALIRDGVILNEYDAAGNAIRSLGRMYDDGTHGDAIANDNVFTTIITLTESVPVMLEVSIAYRGSLRRLTSKTQVAVLAGPTTGLSTLSLIAGALDRNDIDAALVHIQVKPADVNIIRSLSAEDRSAFATFLRSATLESDPGQ